MIEPDICTVNCNPFLNGRNKLFAGITNIMVSTLSCNQSWQWTIPIIYRWFCHEHLICCHSGLPEGLSTNLPPTLRDDALQAVRARMSSSIESLSNPLLGIRWYKVVHISWFIPVGGLEHVYYSSYFSHSVRIFIILTGDAKSYFSEGVKPPFSHDLELRGDAP